MNYVKPGVISRFKEGVLMSTIVGVVKTLNWLVSCWDNVSVSNGLKLEGVNQGTPVLSTNFAFGKGFKVSNGEGGQIKVDVDDEELGGAALKLVGTDGSEADKVKTITFASGDKSNVSIAVSADSQGNATVTIDVFYK